MRGTMTASSSVAIVIDTPGGVLDATRVLVKEMLAYPKPIITFIAPVGSRGASAGVYHHDGRACRRHGASHPPRRCAPGVSGRRGATVKQMPLGEEESDPTEAPLDSQAAMLEKVTEDTVSFARNIAEVRGQGLNRPKRQSRTASHSRSTMPSSRGSWT